MKIMKMKVKIELEENGVLSNFLVLNDVGVRAKESLKANSFITTKESMLL